MKLQPTLRRMEPPMNRCLAEKVMLAIFVCASAPLICAAPADFFRIQIVDQATSRGVPLMRLDAKDKQLFWTDSLGNVAIGEPAYMRQNVFFEVRGDGYMYDGEALGRKGVILDVKPGGSAVVPVRRTDIAERLYRETGAGIYSDSVLTGQKVPTRNPVLNGGVTGQDSVSAVPCNGKIYWFWGDTSGLVHGNTRAAGATSEIPGRGGLDPKDGLDLTYFTDESGFTKGMCPFEPRGMKWLEGATTVRDESGRLRIITRYATVVRLEDSVDWGLAIFNEGKQEFERVAAWDTHVEHRCGHPFHATVNGEEWIYFHPNLRARADMEHLKDLKMYESYTCFTTGTKLQLGKLPELERDAKWNLVYRWRPDTDRYDEKTQKQLIAAGQMKPEEAWFRLIDLETGEPIDAKVGSVCWNDYRKRWIMIAEQVPGQIWYSEADTPLGPWAYAVKIVSFAKYSFYNPTQHPFFDQEDGRRIFFEATYTDSFSEATEQTPRYDYNQIMYTLDLVDSRLMIPAPVYRVEKKGSTSYMMREQIEQENLWSGVREVAFFAFGSDRKPEGTVEWENSSDIYVRPAKDVSSTDSVSGVWQCTAILDQFTSMPFPLDLQLDGKKVTAMMGTGERQPGEGTFDNGKLFLRIPTAYTIFEVNASVREGKFEGEWQNSGTPAKGMVRGQRSRAKGDTKAIVPLYAKTRAGHVVVYTTDPGTSSKLAEIVARVWRNPSEILFIDPEAKGIKQTF